jgi:hypothetical protein
MISAWLTAGVLDRGRFAPTERGSPQGGVISPLLMNVALHGMEEAAGVRYIPTGANAGTARPGSPVVIRYADDLLALCHSGEQVEQVKARLAAWLAPRGLVFNEDKTRIVHLDAGVDFLGFNVRRYRGKLLIKPSTAAVKRIRARLSAEMKALRGHNAQMVLVRLNPIIRGWSAYYRHVVSARVFNELDRHVWMLTYKWAKFSHPHKSKHWIISRYFGAFHPDRRDRWVFGDRDSGAYLLKFAWTKITRHTLVKGWASPDDPALTDYWMARRRRGRPPLDRARLWLLQRQQGRCPLCGRLLLHAQQEPQHPDEWEQWITATRKALSHHLWGAKNRAWVADQRRSPLGHDPGVSLRLLYLIFWQVLGMVLLSCRTSAAKDIELLVLVTRSLCSIAPAHVHARNGRTGLCSPRSCSGCPEHCRATACLPWTRSWVGTAASFADDGPTPTGRTALDRRRARRQLAMQPPRDPNQRDQAVDHCLGPRGVRTRPRVPGC